MVQFEYDKLNDYVQSSSNFLKLDDSGWMAKVRFMYGPNETFTGYCVHNVAPRGEKKKLVPCLREVGQPVDVCPLCKSGNPTMAQYFLPVYVISITSNIGGVPNEQPVNACKVFQRGRTFQGALSSIIRQCQGTPLVSNIFNIVREGAKGSMDTSYIVEYVGRDNTTIEQLPPRVQVLGSQILPNLSYNDMLQIVQPNRQVTPRNVNSVLNNNMINNYSSNDTINPNEIPF